MKPNDLLLSAILFSFPAAALLHAEAPKPSPPPSGIPKVKPYPLDTCIVADEKLGSMGKPIVFTHEGQEIKICCKSCKSKFLKDPGKFLEKLKK